MHLRRARDHLDGHFAGPFDLDHLAALAGVVDIVSVLIEVGVGDGDGCGPPT